MNYHDYIASRDWRQNPTRLAELEAAGFRCRLCNDDGTGSAIEVHHRTYANLGHEQPGDLTALCRTCHRVVTDHQRRLRYGRRVPTHADVRPALENPSPLFDPTFKEAI
jgi:5-methylcytosine-specific restriction endonuclease McrA